MSILKSNTSNIDLPFVFVETSCFNQPLDSATMHANNLTFLQHTFLCKYYKISPSDYVILNYIFCLHLFSDLLTMFKDFPLHGDSWKVQFPGFLSKMDLPVS